MKFNLSKNNKFLISLLVLAITYCNNVNATVCKWDGCTPMYKNWYGVYHRFNRSQKVGFFNELNNYSDQNIKDIKENCDLWEGQWPLNCSMQLTSQNNTIIWTDEFLKEIEEYRKNKKYKPLNCTIPFYSALTERGLFNEVLKFNKSSRLPQKNDCNHLYKLFDFDPDFRVIHRIVNYREYSNLETRLANHPNSNIESYKFQHLQKKDAEILFDFVFFQSFKNFIEQAINVDKNRQNNWWEVKLYDTDFAPLTRAPLLFDTIFNYALIRAINYLSSDLTLDLKKYQAELEAEANAIKGQPLGLQFRNNFDPILKAQSRAEEFKKWKLKIETNNNYANWDEPIELTNILFNADYLAKSRDSKRAVQSDVALENINLLEKLF